jgi:hypothetical protein
MVIRNWLLTNCVSRAVTVFVKDDSEFRQFAEDTGEMLRSA